MAKVTQHRPWRLVSKVAIDCQAGSLFAQLARHFALHFAVHVRLESLIGYSVDFVNAQATLSAHSTNIYRSRAAHANATYLGYRCCSADSNIDSKWALFDRGELAGGDFVDWPTGFANLL